MTKAELLNTVGKMSEAALIQKHIAEYVRSVVELAYEEGYREGRISGLEEARKVLDGEAQMTWAPSNNPLERSK